MELIGLNGKKGSGKDTAGSYLVEHYGYARCSFAGKLKQSALAALGIVSPDEQAAIDFWDEYKNNPKARLTLTVEEDYPGGTMAPTTKVIADISVREYLQFYGTEAHRDIFGADFWTRTLLDTLDPEEKWVITDARFENECSAVRDLGGIIAVIDRPGTDSTDTHASEADLPSELVDVVIFNHGTVEDLHRALDAYVTVGRLATA